MKKAKAASQPTVESAEHMLSTRGFVTLHGLMAVFGCDTYEQLALVRLADMVVYERNQKLITEVRTFLKALGLKPAP